MTRLQFGAIADDFTGAVDLAGGLHARGVRTLVSIDEAPSSIEPSVEAVVVALKSRTSAPDEAVAHSLRASRQLRDLGAQRTYFKYCSTFDSTDRGNIGPVIDALLEELGTNTTVVVPSFPDNGRTVYKSHLFVHDQLLSSSPLRVHPLTPMTEPDLRVLLSRQATSTVEWIHIEDVRKGARYLESRLAQTPYPRAVIIDAIDNDDLRVIAEASRHLMLITGGSGLTLGFESLTSGDAQDAGEAVTDDKAHRAIVCGSASSASREQVSTAIARGMPALRADPFDIDFAQRAREWARDHWAGNPKAPVLVYASATEDPQPLNNGPQHTQTAARLEFTLAETMAAFVRQGARQLIVAGGETSGAVVRRLGATSLLIRSLIEPGVSWASAATPDSGIVQIALKSGNFGTPNFFLDAWKAL